MTRHPKRATGVVVALLLAAVGLPSFADSHDAKEPTLYQRLGGTYPIATVVDDFIERVLVNDTLNANPAIAEARERIPKAGLKFQVAALVIAATGGPYAYHGRDMYEAHKHLNITDKEWEALAKDFKASLDAFHVPSKEQGELFAIVGTTKDDIVLPGNENKALAQRFYEQVINRKNLAGIAEHCAPNFVDHNPMPGQAPGVEGVKESFAAMFRAFPDLHMTVEDILADGDIVITRVVGKGTHKGELMGMQPTGKPVELSGIDIIRLSDGKAIERWGNFDDLGMLRQLGVVPMPPQLATGEPMPMPVMSSDGKKPTPEEAKALAKAMYDAFNTGDMALAEKTIHPRHLNHDPASPPNMPHGIEGFKKDVTLYRTAFPDLRVTVEDQFVQRDRVVTRWLASGTHKGPLGDLPATGKPVKVTGISIDRIADGKVAESWVYWDALGMMTQLGVVPMPGAEK